MKSISLASLYDVLESENESLINSFARVNGFELKMHERNDFMQLIRHLRIIKDNCQQMGFFIGQKTLSGICEEFDFLRFSPDSILNIEVKTMWPSRREKCREQLISHRNVLRLLNPVVYCFTYIVETNELFTLNDDSFESTEFEGLVDIIEYEYIEENLLAHTDFSTMLISPYSEPQSFMNHEYVLTQQQEEVKRKVLSEVEEYSVVKGRAGTGKSLLLMDIARCYQDEGLKVIVFLCRNYDNKLYLSRVLDIRIEEIKSLESFIENGTIDEYDVVLFDEAQRIRPEQLDKIKTLSLRYWKIVFSLDPLQTLNKQEVASGITDKICNLENANVHVLSNRIRANEAIDLFAKRLVHINCKNWHHTDFSCIHLSYFENESNCKAYIMQRHRSPNCVIIEATPYTTKSTRTEKRKKRLTFSRDPHSVLGEEFDHVVVLLDEYVNYVDDGGDRIIGSTYPDYYPYDMNHCIYEAITRAKKSLEIVVLNNHELFVEISRILSFEKETDDISIRSET